MTRGNRLLGTSAAVVSALALAWASTAPVQPDRNEALLRLTWTARPERIETCRTQTEAELAALPVHMRQAVICTGESAAYRLQVRRDDVLLLDEIVHGGGWRRDRPLYVFHELPQPPGDASIDVTFERLGGASTGGSMTGPRALTSDLPAAMALSRHVSFRPGAVVLVTYDSGRRELTTIEREPR